MTYVIVFCLVATGKCQVGGYPHPPHAFSTVDDCIAAMHSVRGGGSSADSDGFDPNDPNRLNIKDVDERGSVGIIGYLTCKSRDLHDTKQLWEWQ